MSQLGRVSEVNKPSRASGLERNAPLRTNRTASSYSTSEVIGDIAERHGNTTPQVMRRSGLEQGPSVIPKSTKPHCTAENIDVFDSELSSGEMTATDGLGTGWRGGPEPEASRSKRSAATSRMPRCAVEAARQSRARGSLKELDERDV